LVLSVADAYQFGRLTNRAALGASVATSRVGRGSVPV
jgi:hypothetical protein